MLMAQKKPSHVFVDPNSILFLAGSGDVLMTLNLVDLVDEHHVFQRETRSKKPPLCNGCFESANLAPWAPKPGKRKVYHSTSILFVYYTQHMYVDALNIFKYI